MWLFTSPQCEPEWSRFKNAMKSCLTMVHNIEYSLNKRATTQESIFFWTPVSCLTQHVGDSCVHVSHVLGQQWSSVRVAVVSSQGPVQQHLTLDQTAWEEAWMVTTTTAWGGYRRQWKWILHATADYHWPHILNLSLIPGVEPASPVWSKPCEWTWPAIEDWAPVLMLVWALTSILSTTATSHEITATLILREEVGQLPAHLHHWLVRQEIQTVESCTEPLIFPEGRGGLKQCITTSIYSNLRLNHDAFQY